MIDNPVDVMWGVIISTTITIVAIGIALVIIN